MKRGKALAEAGRLVEAEAAFRQALSQKASHPDAAYFLGLCLAQMGRGEESLALLERAVSLAPREAMFRHNYALVLAQSGDLAAAERELREAARLAPRDPQVAHNLGFCLFERGDPRGAIECYQRSLALDPRNPMARNNLGNALLAMGDAAAAQEHYRSAIQLEPRFAAAYSNLALVLRARGEDHAAVDAARTGARLAQDAPSWQLFAEMLAAVRFATWDATFAADVAQLLSQDDNEVSGAADAALSLLKVDPAFPPERWDDAGALARPLFLLLISRAVVADLDFEAFLVRLRSNSIEHWHEGRTPPLELLCALAQQCFLNEYLWPESPAESARIELLLGKAQRREASAAELALLAAFRPLVAVPNIQKPSAGKAFDALWTRQVEEPRKEAELRLTIESLTPVEDVVSQGVRDMYEENPYPRWYGAPRPAPNPLARMLRTLFPHVAPEKLDAPDAPRILVAGCGTGRHAAITAMLQPYADILAVDISRASLAHAMRRCGELGLSHLRFGQADLLQLGTLAECFDLIECSGVLHHLREPLTGWRVLLSLLRPGGYMKVALYSELGRRDVVAARACAEPNRRPGLEAVRAARATILALPADHPARNVAQRGDFYSASGVRDLILHVQEHRFTIDTLARAIDALSVEFLGFEFSDNAALNNYRERFPEDPAACSFGNWKTFEQAHPETFSGMYQFWIRKRRQMESDHAHEGAR